MNEITYTQVGDYLLPNITLTDSSNAPPLGRYGAMHEEYLRRGETRPVRHVVAHGAALSTMQGDRQSGGTSAGNNPRPRSGTRDNSQRIGLSLTTPNVKC